MDIESKHEKESILKKWLNRLQEDSWNLELLISGFAIFGLFRLWANLKIYTYKLEAQFGDLGNNVDWFLIIPLVILIIGVIIFIICLISHIFFRGLWIGAIGLRSVSGDLDYDRLKFNKRFKAYLIKKVGDYDDFILRLEKISSSIFALTYILFFVMLSIMLFLIEIRVLTRILSFLEFSVLLSEIIVYSFMALGILVGLDFVTLGIFKRIKSNWFSVIYKHIYSFFVAITFSFVWRPLLYNFIDHKYLRWGILGSIPFLAGVYFFALFSYNRYEFYPQSNFTENGLFESVYYKEHARYSFLPEFYDDLRQIEKEKEEFSVIRVMSIPKHKVDSPILEVFVRYDRATEKSLLKLDSTILAINSTGLKNTDTENSSDYEKAKQKRENIWVNKLRGMVKNHPKKADSLRYLYINNEQKQYRKHLGNIQSALKKIYSFKVNDIPIEKNSVSFSFYIHPNFHEKGLLCVFSVSDIKPGINYLTLNKSLVSSVSNDFQQLDFTIPFIYTGQ